MAVTSLGFNVFSTYNGSGLNRAQRALRGMNSTVKRSSTGYLSNSRAVRAATAAYNAVGRAVRRVTAGMNAHNRVTRLASAATSRLGRMLRSAGSAFGMHGRMARLAGAAHRLFTRDVNRSRASVSAHSRAARAAGSALGGLARMARTSGRALVSHSNASRNAANSNRMLGNSSRSGAGGMRMMVLAAAAATPALLAVSHGALAGATALVVMAATAGSAGVIYGSVMAAAAHRALALEAAGKKLNASQRGFTTSVHALSAAWNRFLDRTSPQTLRPLTVVINALRSGIGRLIPLMNAMAPVAMRVARAFARWVVAENGLKRFISTIIKYGVPALNRLQMAARHVLAFLGMGFRAFAPAGLSLAKILERGARALRMWAAGGGFQRFIAVARANLPTIKAFFSALGGAIRQVAGAAFGLGAPMLRLATIFLRLIAVTPKWMLQALILTFFAYRAASAMAALWTGLLTARMMFARGAMLLFSASTRAAAFATLLMRARIAATIIMMGVYRTVIIAITIIQRAAALATRLWAAAQWALNIAMRANPILFIVTLLILLGTAIYFLVTRTRFFQTVWRYVWNAVKFVALAIWAGLRIAWQYTVNFFIFIFQAIGAGLLAAWRAVWGAVRFAATAIWNGLKAAWRGVVFAFIVVWRAVSGGLRAAWNAVWRGMAAVVRAIWTGIRNGWRGFLRVLWAIGRAIWTGIRNGWRGFWNAIRAISGAVWTGIRNAWRAFLRVIWAIGRAIWTGIRNGWRGFWNAVKAASAAVWTGIRNAWRAFLRVIWAIGRAIWTGIRNGWRGFWNAIKAISAAIWTGIRNAWRGFLRAVTAIGRAAWTFIRNGWRGFWNAIKGIAVGIWNFLKRAWQGFVNVNKRIARQLWDTIKRIFRAGSNWIRNTFWRPVRDFFTKTVPNAFKSAVNLLGRAWNLLKKKLSSPVKAVVDVVYNNGIVKLWNAVAGAFGAPKLKEFKFQGFKEGGYTGDGPTSEVAGVVHRGEYVIPANQYKEMNRKKNLHGMPGPRGLGPQAMQAVTDGTITGGMRGISTVKSGAGSHREEIPRMYKNEFSKPVGGRGGGPITDGDDDGGFFGSIGDFFKEVGSTLAGAVGLNGFSSSILGKLGGLVLGSIAPIANPLIQALANKGKSIVRGVIPGSPWLETLIAGKPGKDKPKGSEGGVGNQGIIQTIADAIKDWITANDATAGCGFEEFRKWRAGDGTRTGPSDRRTMQMLAKAKKNGLKASITQGSWSHAGASAGTHAGGGALDLSPPSNKNVGALRSAGFAAWNRGAKWGSPAFSPHIHAIAVGNKNLSPGAAQQVRDFKAGKNGLAGGGKDNFKDSSCEGGGKAGNCNSYKGMAQKALNANGLGGAGNLNRFMSQMKQESSCNPRAQNNTDSNARAGMASRGLMQVIPPTFKANHCPGTSNNIFDPYANICASARYQKRRYGRVNGSPYRAGTLSALPGWHMVGEAGPEMVRFAGGETVRSSSKTKRAMESAGAEGGTATATMERKGGNTEYHIHINGPVYAKSGQDFENMLAGALQNLKRKRRLPK